MTVSVTTGQRYQNLCNAEVSKLTRMEGDRFPALHLSGAIAPSMLLLLSLVYQGYRGFIP
jgi:hypothetical protein